MDEIELKQSETPETPEMKTPSQQGTLAFIWDAVKIVVISLAIILPVRYFLVQPFFVKGASMEPTFNDGNYILIDEISYRLSHPNRGDVVVFKFPGNTTEFYIKRVIGLPGDTVEVKNNKVTIYNQEHTSGLVLDEKYLGPGQITLGDLKVKLNSNQYFVLGDNRLRSSDSRSWGTVDRSLITGKVFFRAWPINEFGGITKVNY
jgi:signal peptidase I